MTVIPSKLILTHYWKTGKNNTTKRFYLGWETLPKMILKELTSKNSPVILETRRVMRLKVFQYKWHGVYIRINTQINRAKPNT